MRGTWRLNDVLRSARNERSTRRCATLWFARASDACVGDIAIAHARGTAIAHLADSAFGSVASARHAAIRTLVAADCSEREL